MRRSNSQAVSNILGFVFSFSILSLIMSFSVLTTISIIDAKSHEAASVEAQNLANQIADAMVNAITISQSMPNAEYYNYFEFPETLAGFDYYITIENNIISVKTTDGEIHKSCPMYNTNYLAFNIEESITGGQEGISIAYSPPEFIYKIDCGAGDPVQNDSISHSKVKSGYSYVTENSLYDPSLREPKWHDGRDAEPMDGQYGGVCAVDDEGEPYIFVDLNGDWQFDSADDILLNADFDDDGAIANVGGHLAGLYAFDGTIPGGEPFLFEDSNGNWIFDDLDGVPPYDEPLRNDDPDGDGNPATPTGGEQGGLCAIDPYGEPFVFQDKNPDNRYTTSGSGDQLIYLNPDWHYNHQYRIPIKLDNTNGPNINHPIRIVLSSQEIAINKIFYWYSHTVYSNGVFYDPILDKELKYSIEYIKSYDAENPDWYFGVSDLVKENVVFYVNVTIPADITKYIYFYYGSDKYFKNDVNSIADFYDGFDTSYFYFDRIYSQYQEDEIVYGAARDTWDFFYVVGSKQDTSGNVDWWLKQFDVNGYEYDQQAVAGSPDPGWNKTIDGGQGDDCALGIAVNGSPPGIYIVGYKTSTSNGKDWWLKKFSRNGTEDINNWNLERDHKGGDDVANAVAVDDSPTSIYVVGYATDASKDWWIKKFNSNGIEDVLNWGNAPIDGNGGDDVANSVAIDQKHKVYVVGYGTNLNGSTGKDWWIKKFNSNGIEVAEWEKTFDANSGDDVATAVTTDTNGDVYVVGTITNGAGNTDWCIKKFDEDGIGLWEKTLDGEGNQDDVANTIVLDNTDTSDDWSYTSGELLEPDIDGDGTPAFPEGTDKGYLIAYDNQDPAEPYLFKDAGTKWIYDSEYLGDAILDPDGNGINAIPQNNQKAGLYALDNQDPRRPYFFQDTVRDWEYTSGEFTYKIDGAAIPTEGDEGGLYARSNYTGEYQHYTFVDLNFVYVGGQAINQQGLQQMRVIKYYPGGAERWDETFNYPGDGDSSCKAIVIDNSCMIYLAGIGTDFEGSVTGADWWIKKLNYGGGGIHSFSDSDFSPELWSLSHVAYLGYLSSPGISPFTKTCKIPSTSWAHQYILTKDYNITLEDTALYQIEVKFYTNSTKRYNEYKDLEHFKWNSECYSGVILLSQDKKVNYHLPLIQYTLDAYIVELHDHIRFVGGDPDYYEPDHTDFQITKREDGSITQESEQIEIPYLLAGQSSGEGAILRIYLYKNDQGKTVIASSLYHPSTSAPYEDIQVFTDESGSSFLENGRIGIVNFYETWGQNYYCDSIRVIKTVKDAPDVTVGVTESINFGWAWDGIVPAGAGEQDTTFCMDPLLYDYVEVPIEIGNENVFIIGKLTSDIYQISLTIGENTEACELMYGFREEGQLFTFPGSIILPATADDEFIRVWCTQDVQVPEGKYGELGLKFVGDSLEMKKISSITVEKVEQYVGFESTPD